MKLCIYKNIEEGDKIDRIIISDIVWIRFLLIYAMSQISHPLNTIIIFTYTYTHVYIYIYIMQLEGNSNLVKLSL